MVTDQFISFQPRNCSGPKFVQHMTKFYKKYDKFVRLSEHMVKLYTLIWKIQYIRSTCNVLWLECWDLRLDHQTEKVDFGRGLKHKETSCTIEIAL